MTITPRAARVALAALALVLFAGCSPPGSPDAQELVPPPSDPALTAPVASLTPSSPGPTAESARLAAVKFLLINSSQRHGVNAYLVMGVAWWESGWDQSRVSSAGAIGIMQVEPATAASAGPRLLHRAADVNLASDNVELGVAVLREDLDLFNNDLAKALTAYYEGPSAVTDWNDQDAGAKRYVWGVYRLAVAFSEGTGPA